MKYTPSVILLSALLAPAGFAAIPTALPSFKSEKQLTTWRAEQAAKSTTASASESSDFYTGKPYVPSSKGYAFKYRTYTPAESRWTSEDPSGFPDGANSNAYAPIPTSELDWAGLLRVVLVSASGRTDAPTERYTTLSGAVVVDANQAVYTSGFNIFAKTAVGLFHGVTTSTISGTVGISPGGNEILLNLSSPSNQTSGGLAVSAVSIANITYSDNNKTVSFSLTYGGSSSFGGLSIGSGGVSSTGSGYASGFATITYTLE